MYSNFRVVWVYLNFPDDFKHKHKKAYTDCDNLLTSGYGGFFRTERSREKKRKEKKVSGQKKR